MSVRKKVIVMCGGKTTKREKLFNLKGGSRKGAVVSFFPP
jgi:hypothetical protein